MGERADHDFSWRLLLGGAARVEHPRLRRPVSLIVDDPCPGYNPAHFHSGFRNGPMHVPPTLIDSFADLIEETGIRGKFSVIPNPFGLGRVDRAVQGVSPRDLAHFLDVVRGRIAPRMDITPEVLTHWNAIDLQTGQLLPLWEHVWSRAQSRETLEPYLALALEILGNADLPCSGMTSPWNFGGGVEDAYAEALLGAQRTINGRTLTWYFLHSDVASPLVPPRLQVFRPEAGEAAVSIVCCDASDFAASLWRGEDPRPDALLSEDGQEGRLAEVLSAGGPAVFHTHWQSIFGFGSDRGLDGLRTVTARLDAHFAGQFAWIGCAALASYAAAAAALTLSPVEAGGAGVAWSVQSPFPSRDFTLSLEHAGPVAMVSVDGVPLRRVESRADLAEGRYLLEDGRLILCWPLDGTQRIAAEIYER